MVKSRTMRLPQEKSQYKELCTVGWSDLALFEIFEKLHVSANQVYY